MNPYADLIPGAARKTSAYADLLPARTPAPDAPPAEASGTGVKAPPPGTKYDWEKGPTLLQRAAIAAEPYLVPQLKTVQAVASGYPDVEAATNMATGMASLPVAGIAGLVAKGAQKLGYDVDPSEWIANTSEALTYQPKTELGRHLAEALNSPFALLQKGADVAGGKTTDVTGSPAAGAAVNTTVSMLPFAIPGAPKAVRELRRRVIESKATRGAPEPAKRIEPTMEADQGPASAPPVEPTRQPVTVTPTLKPKPVEAPSPYADLIQAGSQERRVDLAKRQKVADMTPEQMRQELLTSQFGEIGNRRAYEEAPKKPVQVALDADSLKWINDNLGHEAGDSLLAAVSKSLKKVAPEDSYHLSGDEFVLQADHPKAADTALAALEQELAKHQITYEAPDGKVYTYAPRLSYGKGSTLKEADLELAGSKAAREQAGLRAGRGQRPVGLAEEPAAGGQAPDLTAQELAPGIKAGAPLYRGYGRKDRLSVYGGRGEGVPIAGKGRYYFFKRDHAEGYGPKIAERKLDLKSPLVITDGDQWRALTKEAGWKHPNPTGTLTEAQAKSLRDLVTKRGHDGIIVSWDTSKGYDIGPKGEDWKLLNRVFDYPQVIDYRKPSEAAAVERGAMGMPAHVVTADTAAAAGPVPPASGAHQVPLGQARPDAIRQAMTKLFDTVINEKHQGARNLGIYRIKPETIRVRNRNDLRTIGHEVGHHISNRNRAFRKVMRAHDGELIAMMPEAYKQRVAAGKKMPHSLQVEEGFAEFMTEYFGDRATAQRKAPKFFNAFESWLAENKPFKQAVDHVSDMIGAHQALSPADKILSKVGVYEPRFREKVQDLASREQLDTFVQAALDKWHPLKLMVADLSPELAASKNPYIAARLLPGDAAIIEDWVGNFTSPFDYAKRADPRNYGKPLKEILRPVLEAGPDTLRQFKAYLIAKRAAELKRVGKENLFTPQEIADGLKLETAQFKQVANEVYKYNDSLLDYAVEGGLLSPDTAAKFREYTAYIPFFREAEATGKGAGGKGQPFKRLKGGTQNLHDPIANLVQNTASIIHATNRNAVLKKSVELAKAVSGGGKWMETVPVPSQAHRLATQRIIDQLREQDVVIDTTMAEDLAAIQTFFTKTGRGDERTRTIVYKDGGDFKAAQINDPLLWKAVGNMAPPQMGLITKMLAFPANTLRMGVVLDPTFMVRNFVRDTLTSTLQSQGNFIPVTTTARGIKLMAQNADAYKLWRAFGGAYSEYGLEELRGFADNSAIIRRMAKRGGFRASSIVTPSQLLHAYKRLGSYTESGSRIGEFEATYKPGDFDSALQAALNARDVSTDFGMRGGDTAINTWTRIVPFMNPAMQGLYKGARVLSGADGRRVQIRAAVVGSGMALASIGLALENSDQEWYQKLEPWEKATYWHFKMGGEIWRVPKPFEYGMLFASTPEAIALYQAGKENGEEFKQRMTQVLDQVAFRVVPQVATIVAEPWANKSFFTGRPIVPDRQSHLEPGMQATPSTSKVAQVAGGAANVSPAVIDNVVRNTFGTVGVQIETAADMLLEKTGTFPSAREKSWREWPAVRAFVHDPNNPNSKQIDDFYNALDKYRTAVASLKELRNRGEDEKAAAYEAEHQQEIYAAREAERTAKKLATIRRKIRAIQWSRDLTAPEKTDEINLLNQEMQGIAAEQTQLYQQAKKSYSRPSAVGGR